MTRIVELPTVQQYVDFWESNWTQEKVVFSLLTPSVVTPVAMDDKVLSSTTQLGEVLIMHC